jgi:hypothetical protein
MLASRLKTLQALRQAAKEAFHRFIPTSRLVQRSPKSTFAKSVLLPPSLLSKQTPLILD